MRLVPERSPFPRIFVFPLLGGAAVLVWLARTRAAAVLGSVHCPLRDATGIPCPTCGGTHAFVSLARGAWGEALDLNPLVPVGAVALALWCVPAVIATCVPRWRYQVELAPREAKAARWGSALLLVTLWIIQILRLA